MVIRSETYRTGERGLSVSRYEDGTCYRPQCTWHKGTSEAKDEVKQGIEAYNHSTDKKQAYAAAHRMFNGLAAIPAGGRLHAAQYAHAYARNRKFGNDIVTNVTFLLKRGMEETDPTESLSVNDNRRSAIGKLKKFEFSQQNAVDLLSKYKVNR